MEIPHGRELFQFHSLGWPHSLLPKTSDHRKSRGLVSGALGCSLSLGMEDRAVSWDAGFHAKVQGVQTKGTGWSLPAHLSLLVRPVTKTAQSPDEMGWDSAPRHRKDRLAAWKRHFLEGDLSPLRDLPSCRVLPFPLSLSLSHTHTHIHTYIQSNPSISCV